MRRFVPIALGLALVLGTASIGLAARPGPTTHQISMSIATTDVSAGCVGTGTLCDGTVRLTFTGTVSGQSPFSEFKAVRDPQTVVGTFDFPTSGYDSDTGCFSAVLGVIQFLVPHGSRTRLAFELDSNSGAGCGGSFSAPFTVDSDQTEGPLFRQATGSGTLSFGSDLDLEAVTVSALEINLTGELSTTR